MQFGELFSRSSKNARKCIVSCFLIDKKKTQSRPLTKGIKRRDNGLLATVGWLGGWDRTVPAKDLIVQCAHAISSMPEFVTRW
jgi:hypothetical protein